MKSGVGLQARPARPVPGRDAKTNSFGAMPMLLKMRSVGEKLVIVPQSSYLDSGNAPSFKTQILESIKKGRFHLVINFSQEEFIDSSGLAALISLVRNLGAEGEVVVSNPSPTLASLFDLTRLDRIIRVFSDENLALVAMPD